MEAVIIEDESLSAERLVHLLQKVDSSVRVSATLNSVESALEWFRDNSQPDLVFLDIQLGDGSAFDFLEQVDVLSPIIFTTAYDEYAIKAFKFNSIDYLLKPIEIELLRAALKKLRDFPQKEATNKSSFQTVRKIVNNDYQKRFLIKIGDQYKNVEVDDIAFFFHQDGQCYVTIANGQNLPIDQSLDQLEDKLSPVDFFRVNRQFITHAKSIEEIHSYFNSRLMLKLKPDQKREVVVSRDRVNGFKAWLDS